MAGGGVLGGASGGGGEGARVTPAASVPFGRTSAGRATGAKTMARCKHQRVEVTEQFLCATVHTVENGHSVDHYAEPMEGEYTGIILARCLNCGYERKFNRYVSMAGLRRVPQWVQDAAEAAGCPFVVVRR